MVFLNRWLLPAQNSSHVPDTTRDGERSTLVWCQRKRPGSHASSALTVTDVAGSPLSATAAFENECQILARLHGLHVPRLVAVGDPRRRPYLVMEYIEGDTLARASARTPLSVERVRDLGARLCRAVHALHRQSVIHLDLNPGNVRDRASGEMVLVDFGVAHHAALPDYLDSAFGEEEGTTPYIAPEQVRHLRTEPRSDIYAIGAILYQLATGQYPHGRPNLLSLKKRLFEPAPPPRLVNPGIPPWLQEIILRCLAIRPERRYPTARQVAYLLAHPEAVHLTERAQRRSRPGVLMRARLWLRSLYEVLEDTAPRHPQEHLTRHAHVLVALDLAPSAAPLRYALRDAVRKFTRSEPNAYFTFLSVLGRDAAWGRRNEATAANSPAVVCLAEMRNWAQPLHLAPERVHFQIIPGEPVAALVAYAQTHAIDHLIVGARGDETANRLLGNVSYRVMLQAPCSVTVVRSRRPATAPPAKRRTPRRRAK